MSNQTISVEYAQEQAARCLHMFSQGPVERCVAEMIWRAACAQQGRTWPRGTNSQALCGPG